jgi:hypothetical protein
MTDIAYDVRYPIGKFDPKEYSEDLKKEWIRDLKFLPDDVEIAIQTFDEFQLDTPYRKGGWTIRQLVHHIADSHMNAFIRFKLALTEDNPVIKPYNESEWAKLPDVFSVPVNVSVTLLHALHRRLVALAEEVTENQWKERSVYHPEYKKKMSLWDLLGMYSWHSRHHVAHINKLKEHKGW